MEIIRCEEVGLKKQGQTILESISFSVQSGEIVGIVGPSGSGKSSLLRLMNLLQSPTQGKIIYQGQVITEYDPLRLRREVGYVPQKPYLFAGTVRDNLRYPYILWGQKPDMGEIAEYMSRLCLPAAVLDKRGVELSGGEQQRAALIRSLLAKPRVVLLDEVSASLDEGNTLLMERMIAEKCQAGSLTALFVSHNPEQVRRFGQSVVCIDKGRMRFFGSAAQFGEWQGGVRHE